MHLACDACGKGMKMAMPRLPLKVLHPNHTRLSVGFLGITWLSVFWVSTIGVPRFWRRKVSTEPTNGRSNAIAAGRYFGANRGMSTGEALRCNHCGEGHFVLVSGS